MTYSLNLIKVLKNSNFKKIILFNKIYLFMILFLSFISTSIYTSFPLITQFFILKVYRNNNLSLLFYATIVFFILFLFKIFIDIKIEKYKNKFFLKVEKNIKELILEKYESKLFKYITFKSDLSSKHLHMYLLLIRTVYNNLLDIVKILIVSFIIFFFDRHLFFYFLYSIPFFFLFYLIGKKIQLTSNYFVEKKDKFSNINSFELLIKNVLDKRLNPKESKKVFMNHLENNLKKRIINKSRFIPLNVVMRSFISFYRLFYLAYFGYYMISNYVQISGLIVSLLYITILIRPIIRILESLNFYTICHRSFYKINSLYKRN